MKNPYANFQVPDQAKRPATANFNPARRAKSVAMTQSQGIQMALDSQKFSDSAVNPGASTQNQTNARPQTSLQNPLNGSVTLSQFKQEIEDINLANYYKNLNYSEVDYTKQIRFGTKMDSVEEIAKLMRLQVFDHIKFNVFLDSVFGKTLLKGLLEAQVDPKGKVSSFIREHNTYPKAMRNARLETMAFKRENIDFRIGKRNLPSTTKLTKQIEAFISKAENYTCAKVLADKFKNEIKDPEKAHRHNELVRMKARVKEEMRRHSSLTTSTRVNPNNLTIEQLIKLLEFNPMDLSVDPEEDKKRHELMMDAMLFLFRAIDIEDWQDINMENMDEKMKILTKLKKKDFQSFNNFNNPHDIGALKLEQKVLQWFGKQNENKTHLQLLIEKKHQGQDSPFKQQSSQHKQKSVSNSQTSSPLLRNKSKLNSITASQIQNINGSTAYKNSFNLRSDNNSSSPGTATDRKNQQSSLTNYQKDKHVQRREFNILEDDDDGILSNAFLTPKKRELANKLIPYFYQSAKTQLNSRSNKQEVQEYTQNINKFKFSQNLQKNRMRSAQKVSIIPQLQNQKQTKNQQNVTTVASENPSETSQIGRRKAIAQRAKMASNYIVTNCLSATKQDQNNERLIEGCNQITEYQSMLKDALFTVTEKNQQCEKKDQLMDIKGTIKAINHEEAMNYKHFFCPFETNLFKEQTRKVTHYISGITKHQKREIWKPSKFQVGRFTTVGKMLNQA